MPYSLVSAATLGFDLVRLPGGRSVAEVLLTGLAADADLLRRLAAVHPGRDASRQRRGVLAVRSRRARELAAAAPRVHTVAAEPAGAPESRAAALVAQLERGTIGNAPNLERLVREDVLGAEQVWAATAPDEVRGDAADVLADAAVGFWAAVVLPPLVHRELTLPFLRVLSVPPEGSLVAALGPAARRLEELLTSVSRLDESGRGAWRAAVEEGRGAHRPWATAMHEACWAAHVSGRTRTLAAAHLQAVLAFYDGGFDGRDGAHGVWNALAGCVQGLAMADLLDRQALDVLTAPWVRVTGRSPA